MNKPIKLSAFALLTLNVNVALAEAPEVTDIGSALASGEADIALRWRSEWVDQDGFEDNAMANTLRTRLTYQSEAYNGFSLLAEIDNVSAVGGETYNSTVNGMAHRPVVADPTGSDLNQGYVQYQQQGWRFRAGRQRILLDDQRFVGGVGWRQNEQTYDGYRVTYSGHETLTVDYSYVHNVNRIFGDDSPKGDLGGQIHLANVRYQPSKQHTLTAFSYWLDFETVAAASTRTFGMRYQGQWQPLSVTASWANQQDHGDNPNHIDADYKMLEVGIKAAGIQWSLGTEQLGAGQGVFSTPLATLHKFQGFADKFLGTPGRGIVDNYLGAAGMFESMKLALKYHRFDSEQGSLDYGDEWDAVAAFPVTQRIKGLLKLAHFNAKDHASDTTKLWLSVSAKF